MKCPHCGNKVSQIFLQEDNTYLMVQCTVCLFRCDGAYWEKVEMFKDTLKEIVDLYENPLGVVIDGAEMGQIAKQALGVK